jgi:glutamate-1-semialdehyde 2,1-aminomutase
MSPSAGEDIIVLPWNDLDILRKTMERQGDEIAAIIQEPILCATNTIVPKPGYLEGMRRLCDDHGIVMIFDEVVTGFRVAAGGAQELLGVTPDLATYAKAMSGGFPVAMMAGKREIMSLLGDGTVHHGGALNSNRVNMAAVLASLRKFTENDNAMYRPLYAIGNKLMEGLRRLGDKHEQPILVQGPGPVFSLAFTDAKEITDYRSHVRNADEEKYERFQQGMLERGVRLFPRGFWFVSTAHTEEDVERTLAAADEVLASL